MLSQNLLARRIAAYRASGNIGCDKFGERAKALFNDSERLVRDEASHCNWDGLLSGNSDNQKLAYEFVAWEALVDHEGRFTHAL